MTKIPNKLVNKNSRICSIHFEGGKRKTLYEVLLIFSWSRKPPLTRTTPIRKKVINKVYNSTHSQSIYTPDIIDVVQHDHTYCMASKNELSNVAGVY